MVVAAHHRAGRRLLGLAAALHLELVDDLGGDAEEVVVDALGGGVGEVVEGRVHEQPPEEVGPGQVVHGVGLARDGAARDLGVEVLVQHVLELRLHGERLVPRRVGADIEWMSDGRVYSE
jgi:hypothetical protein